MINRVVLLVAIVSSQVSISKDVVFQAFNHPSGFVLFQVTTEEKLKKRTNFDNPLGAGGVVYTVNDKWFFGATTGGKFIKAGEFFRLQPYPSFSSFNKSSASISFSFFSADEKTNDVTFGHVSGTIKKPDGDPTADVVGEVMLSVGRNLNKEKFTFSPDRVKQLNDLLTHGRAKLIDSMVDIVKVPKRIFFSSIRRSLRR